MPRLDIIFAELKILALALALARDVIRFKEVNIKVFIKSISRFISATFHSSRDESSLANVLK